MNILSYKVIALILIPSLITLSGCSSKKTVVPTGKAVNMQKIETGTVVSVKTIAIKPETTTRPYGNVGISIGSGGRSGVFGSVDIGRIFRNSTKPTTALRLIINKSNGEMVAITQAVSKENFKQGDTVKLLIENGKAKVIH